MLTTQATEIIAFLRKNISKHPSDIVDLTMKHFNVTRTTVHRHLNKLINSGEVIKTGKTRDVMYYLTNAIRKKVKFSINNHLDESKIYDDCIKSSFKNLAKNVESICNYGFTEIFNNVIDHSIGTYVWVETKYDKNIIKIIITDDGVGIFKTIYDFFQLDDIRESVLQLSKGKMTTSPEHHTGEGLFFSSRAFDVLEIFANNIHYIRNNIEHDWFLETYDTSKFGSKVVMQIASDSKQDLVTVFKIYQESDSFNFNKTDIFVKLSQFKEEQLISRSQAKRILRGLEGNFKVVILDFAGVTLVGQGFVDEIFRVYKNQHKDIEFKYINANEDVEFMIKRSI